MASPQSDQPQRHRDTELDQLSRLTQRVIGAAIEVHRHLGQGLPESVYERAMCIEFELRGIGYENQVPVAAVYKGHVLGEYRIDFIVEHTLLLEIKSVVNVTPIFEGQVLTYLRVTGQRLALLLNFHERRLTDGIRRFAL
jgi:GxxExxY protein